MVFPDDQTHSGPNHQDNRNLFRSYLEVIWKKYGFKTVISYSPNLRMNQVLMIWVRTTYIMSVPKSKGQ
jgi:hypothetical protein